MTLWGGNCHPQFSEKKTMTWGKKTKKTCNQEIRPKIRFQRLYRPKYNHHKTRPKTESQRKIPASGILGPARAGFTLPYLWDEISRPDPSTSSGSASRAWNETVKSNYSSQPRTWETVVHSLRDSSTGPQLSSARQIASRKSHFTLLEMAQK